MGDRVFEKLADPRGAPPIFVFAADALVAGGVHSLGRQDGRPRTRPQFLELVRRVTADGAVDGVLMTPADAEILALRERIFDASPVTPIVRMNAETGIWNPRHGAYRAQHSLPFPTLPLEEASYCETMAGAVLACHVHVGLYSITLDNDTVHDEHTLNAYLRFAQAVGRTPGFFHFLEVFLPNADRRGLTDEQCGAYVADSIARTMSYLRIRERPLLVKTEYTTAPVWRELCDFDPSLAVGALGGPRRSARDTLQLAADVAAHGGRAVLFGRALFEEDDPVAMARALRAVLDGERTVEGAHAGYRELAAVRAPSPGP